ncbi:MAG: Ig-like domain-containing protein [Candidatus Margulisbacteria bacterium]|nr:Ig-like domain-containing protein [Candidatus Margulisiibacteriota bacterium]
MSIIYNRLSNVSRFLILCLAIFAIAGCSNSKEKIAEIGKGEIPEYIFTYAPLPESAVATVGGKVTLSISGDLKDSHIFSWEFNTDYLTEIIQETTDDVSKTISPYIRTFTANVVGTHNVTVTAKLAGKEVEVYTFKILFNEVALLNKIDFLVKDLKIKVNDTQQLIPNFTPAEAIDKVLKWVSLDESIVTVDENGVITGVTVGGPVNIEVFLESNPSVFTSISVRVVEAGTDTGSGTTSDAEEEPDPEEEPDAGEAHGSSLLIDTGNLYDTGEAQVNEPDTTRPSPPTGVTLETLENSFVLRWTNPSDLDFRETVILRSEISTPPNSATDTNPAYTSYTISKTNSSRLSNAGLSNRTYYYYLYAKDHSGNFSDVASKSGKPLFINPPAAPLIFINTDQDSKVTYSWYFEGQSGLIIARSTVDDINTAVEVGSSLNNDFDVALDNNFNTRYSFTDDTVTNGTTYYYFFTFTHTNYDDTYRSSAVTPRDNTPPAEVTNLQRESLDDSDNRVKWSWTNPTDYDFYRAEILIQEGVTPPASIDSEDNLRFVNSNWVIIDSSHSNDSYFIYARDTSGNFSDPVLINSTP